MDWRMMTTVLCTAAALGGAIPQAAAWNDWDEWMFYGDELAERQSPEAVLRYFNEAVPPAEISAQLLQLLRRDPVPPSFFPQYRQLSLRLHRIAHDPWQEWTPEFWRTVVGALRYAALFDLLLADQTDSGAPLILLALEGTPALSSLVPFAGGKTQPVFSFHPGQPVVFTVAALPKRPLAEVGVTAGELFPEDSATPLKANITLEEYDQVPLMGAVTPQFVPLVQPALPQPLRSGYRLYRVTIAPFALPQNPPLLPVTGRIRFSLPQESRMEDLIYQLQPSR